MIPIEEESIINILGIASLPDDRKAAIIDQTTELVQKRLLLRILDSLSEQDRTGFESLLSNENQEAIDKFLSDKVPNLSQWLEEEVNKIKQEFADLAGKIE